MHYTRISSGTGFADAVYEHTSSPTAFYKSRITWNGHGWNLDLKDGLRITFPDSETAQRPAQAGATSLRDRYGNTIALTRNTDKDLTGIASPSGRWITLTYDTSHRVTQAKDNSGRTVGYTYDASGRLWKVTDPASGVTEYTYDTSHRMLTLKDARGIVFLTNQYDANGRVSQQTQLRCIPCGTRAARHSCLDAARHSGVIALFQQRFVKTGVIPADVARALPRAFEKRQNSDYEDFAEIALEDANRVAAEVAAFVDHCARALERELSRSEDGGGDRDLSDDPPESA